MVTERYSDRGRKKLHRSALKKAEPLIVSVIFVMTLTKKKERREPVENGFIIEWKNV